MVTCFKLLFMHSLSKASHINKRHCMGSIYKQSPSRNLSCSVVCFPLLPCSWPTDHRPPASPACLQQKRVNKEIPGPKLFKRFPANTSGPVNFQNLGFGFKIKKGLDAHHAGCCRAGKECQWLERYSLPLERFWNGEEQTSMRRDMCKRNNQIWCFWGIHMFTHCHIPIPEVTNLIWQITPMAKTPLPFWLF